MYKKYKTFWKVVAKICNILKFKHKLGKLLSIYSKALDGIISKIIAELLKIILKIYSSTKFVHLKAGVDYIGGLHK